MEHAPWWFFRVSEKPSLFNKFIFLVFALTQIFDGIFTYYGVKIFGMEIEGNPLMVLIMASLGVGTGLIMAKLTAVLVGIGLYKYGYCNIILVGTLLYLIVAILPWAYLFFVVFPTLPS